MEKLAYTLNIRAVYCLLPIACFFLTSCQNLEDAKITDRNTFVHFYEGANSIEASVAELTADGGYIIAGTIKLEGDRKIIIIKTDKLGMKQWQKIIDGGSASNLKVVTEGNKETYLVIGQRVEFNPFSINIDELENYSSRLIRLSENGEVIADVLSYNRKIGDAHVDYYGNAVTLDDNGDIITLGTFREPGKNEFSYVAALDIATLDTLWEKQYNYIVRDYANAKSVHYTGGKVLWGTSISETQGFINRSYLAIPVILEKSTFTNSDYYGQDQEQQSLKIKDLQQSPWGYGAIGTYSQPDGSKRNVFFIGVDRSGNFMKQTIRYFDGNSNEGLTDPSQSDIEDEGEAITATRDGGYILAGSIETSPLRGKGGKDIWLIKIDAFGEHQWNKTLGGSPSETVASIRETPDGGLLICGTIRDGSENTGGLASIFLMRTDRNGELKD